MDPATAAAGPGSARPPAELFAVLTMQVRTLGGIEVRTAWATVTVQPGVTRKDVFEHLRGQFREHFRERDATVLFSSPEPGQLAAG